jgi:hypothetical protein
MLAVGFGLRLNSDSHQFFNKIAGCHYLIVVKPRGHLAKISRFRRNTTQAIRNTEFTIKTSAKGGSPQLSGSAVAEASG